MSNMTINSNFSQALRTAFTSALAADIEGDTRSAILQTLDTALARALETSKVTTTTAVKAKKDKKNRSAYQIWKSDSTVKEEFRTAHPDIKGANDFNKAMGEEWKAIKADASLLAKWTDLAAQEKIAYDARKADTDVKGNDDGKTKTKKSSKKDKKPRGRTAYMLYKMDDAIKQRIVDDHPSATFGEKAKIVAAWWGALDEGGKTKWTDMAAAEKATIQKAKKPKNARTAYMLFKMDDTIKKRVADEHPEADFGDKAKIVAGWWKALSPEEKAPFDALALKDKARFATESSDSEASASDHEDNDSTQGDADYAEHTVNVKFEATEEAEDKDADASAKVEDASAKVEDTTAKVEDASAKVEDTSAKVEDASAKVEDASAKVEETTAKDEEVVSIPKATAEKPKKATRRASPYVNFKNDLAKKAEIEAAMTADGIEINKGNYGKECRTAWAALSAEEQNVYKTA